MTFFTNSKKYAKKIKKAEKCLVYENTVRELFSCEHFTFGLYASVSLIKASTASSASPETPPKSLIPTEADMAHWQEFLMH